MLDFIIAAFKYIFSYIKEHFFELFFVAVTGEFLGNLFNQWLKKRKRKKLEQKDP